VAQRSLASAVCGWRGHVTPAAATRDLDGPLLLGADVDLGAQAGRPEGGAGSAGERPVRLARCLRCDAWVVFPPPDPATAVPLPAPGELDLPRRGEQLRSAVVLRLIAIERIIHVVIYGIVAALAIALRADLVGVKSWVRHLLSDLTTNSNATSGTFNNSILVKEGNHLLTLKSSTLDVVIIAALAYAVIEGVEAVGLWLEKRWAEYLTVVATVGFIPFEIEELTKSVSVFKILALVINVVVLVYLLWAKELFGIGRLRHRKEEPADPLAPFYRPEAGGAPPRPPTESSPPANSAQGAKTTFR
jgi:uncharacterized membrane protein (DUF2068 family)